MTDTPIQLDLSPAAEARLNDYLHNVRAELAGADDVNPDDIEADIREHVENELRGAARPVSLAALEAVLARLGPPSQWESADHPSLLQRVGHLLGERLRGARSALAGRWRNARTAVTGGPNDWRLAYLSFGVFALGVMTILLFPFCLVVSYFLSRAGMAAAREQGVELGASRKWLLYPPVAIVSTVLLGSFLLGPPIAATAVITDNFDDMLRKERRALAHERQRDPVAAHSEVLDAARRIGEQFPGNRETRELLAGLFIGAGCCSAWWLVAGILAILFPATARAVFPPLCNGLRRKHGLKLAAFSIVLLVIWLVIAFEIAAKAGVIR